MQIAYTPVNIIDAHLAKGLLGSCGIEAWIRGEHLMGAVGELPAVGLLAVMVADEDLEAARRVIEDWDNARIEDDASLDDGCFRA